MQNGTSEAVGILYRTMLTSCHAGIVAISFEGQLGIFGNQLMTAVLGGMGHAGSGLIVLVSVPEVLKVVAENLPACINAPLYTQGVACTVWSIWSRLMLLDVD